MLLYLVILIIHILISDIVFYLTNNLTVALLFRLIVIGAILYFFRERFKFRIRFDFLAILIGLVIFILWVALEGYYPHFGISSVISYNLVEVIIKMITFVVITPVIEEFFTRFFLIRWVISKDWIKIPLGKYTFGSFLVSVFFFGFAHSRWLPGLISGVLLNLLFYKRKNIESCVLAHAVANLALGIYVIYTGNWQFW